jgi:phage/conjugal plasmid C-4 type zinc finger TraR family protein
MDICDRAQKVEEHFLTTALRKATVRIPDRPLYKTGVRCCVDCEEPIPEKRIEVKPDVTRCVECQTVYERNYGNDR